MKTTGYSRPFAACIVIMMTLSSSDKSSASATSDTCSKNSSTWANSFADDTNSPKFSRRPASSTEFSLLNSARYPDFSRTASKSAPGVCSSCAATSSMTAIKDSIPRRAAPDTPASPDRRKASKKLMFSSRAKTSSRLILVSPMPRLGMLRTRFTLTSSSGLVTTRK